MKKVYDKIQGGEGGEDGAQARGVPVGVVGRVDRGVAEAVVRDDALAGRRGRVERRREFREAEAQPVCEVLLN